MLKKKKNSKCICSGFDFTSQDMYDKLIKAINKYTTVEEQKEIIQLLDKLIEYIFMYW